MDSHQNTMDNDSSQAPNANFEGNASKGAGRKEKHKNEPFYQKKRALNRKAEQLKKSCDAQVFVAVYKMDAGKIYTYQTDTEFNLQRVNELVLQDVQQGAFLNKNKKFEEVDFGRLKIINSKLNQLSYTGKSDVDQIGSNQMTSEGGDCSGYNFHDIAPHLRPGEPESAEKPIFGINHAGKDLTHSGLKSLPNRQESSLTGNNFLSQSTMMTTPKNFSSYPSKTSSLRQDQDQHFNPTPTLIHHLPMSIPPKTMNSGSGNAQMVPMGFQPGAKLAGGMRSKFAPEYQDKSPQKIIPPMQHQPYDNMGLDDELPPHRQNSDLVGKDLFAERQNPPKVSDFYTRTGVVGPSSNCLDLCNKKEPEQFQKIIPPQEPPTFAHPINPMRRRNLDHISSNSNNISQQSYEKEPFQRTNSKNMNMNPPFENHEEDDFYQGTMQSPSDNHKTKNATYNRAMESQSFFSPSEMRYDDNNMIEEEEDIKSRSNVVQHHPPLQRESSGSRSGHSAMVPPTTQPQKQKSYVNSSLSGVSNKFSLKQKEGSSSGISQGGEGRESQVDSYAFQHNQINPGGVPRLHAPVINPSQQQEDPHFSGNRNYPGQPQFGHSASIANRKMKNYFDQARPSQKTFGTQRGSQSSSIPVQYSNQEADFHQPTRPRNNSRGGAQYDDADTTRLHSATRAKQSSEMPPRAFVSNGYDSYNPSLHVIQEHPFQDQIDPFPAKQGILPTNMGGRVGNGAFGKKVSIQSSYTYSNGGNTGNRNFGESSPQLMIPGPREFGAKRRSIEEDIEMQQDCQRNHTARHYERRIGQDPYIMKDHQLKHSPSDFLSRQPNNLNPSHNIHPDFAQPPNCPRTGRTPTKILNSQAVQERIASGDQRAQATFADINQKLKNSMHL